MAKNRTVEELLDAQIELQRDMFIAFLAAQAVPQREIAATLRLDLNRVNRIAKLLKRRKGAKNAEER